MCRDIQVFLNSTWIRKLLRTDPEPAEYLMASDTINQAFTLSGDYLQFSTSHIAGLLERGIRVLIYAGTLDLVCGVVAIDRTSRIIQWSGQDAFVNTPMRNWEVDGITAGQIRKSGLLTFASIYGAGHMVSAIGTAALHR
jgi:carboxypeptidase C (cathepsin A)